MCNVDKQSLSKKSRTLKLAIERFNMYKRFVDTYNKSKSLDEYINHLSLVNVNASNDTLIYYEGLIKEYELGNHEPLLTNLYNKLLAADECKTKTAEDLKSYLR